MKTAALVLINQIFTVGAALAQINWQDYLQSYTENTSHSSPSVGLILALRKGNDFLWSVRERSKHFYTLDKDAVFHRLRPKEIIARTTFDTARAQFFMRDVDLERAQLYQFRVVEYPTNRVLVAWHNVNQFADSAVVKSSGMPRMACLGGYKTTFGQMLIVDVRKTGSNDILATSLVAWESITPVITNIYTSETLDEFFKKLQDPWAQIKEPSSQQSGILQVPSTNTNFIFVLRGNVFYKHQIQYQVIRDGNVYTPWRYNAYGNSFVWVKDYPPGSLKSQNKQLEILLQLLHAGQNKSDQRITLTTTKEIYFVKTDEIIRCESSNNYNTFYLASGESMLVCKPIYEYEDLLKDYGFMRCHQSHLVNNKYVKSWKRELGDFLLMIDGKEVPISRGKKEDVKRALDL